jgi:quercetin dioxygenase-like cupin family protein
MRIVTCAVLVGLAVVSSGHAQQPAASPSVSRNIVLKQDMAMAGHEGVVAVVDLPPGATEPRHTHPAEVFAYVLAGTSTIDVEGEATKTLKAGEAFHVAPGKVHSAKNPGSEPAKLVVVFIAEKGRPLSTPAP